MIAVRRLIPPLILVLFLAALGFVLGDRGRNLSEALTFLVEVWSIDAEPAAAGGRPRPFSYAGPGGDRRVADLYCEPAPPGGRLVLIHGLVETGKDDARLRALGRALARRRFLVLVPDFPGMRSLRVGRGDVDEVRAALEAVQAIEGCGGTAAPAGTAPPGSASPAARRDGAPLPTGIIGFSYSAGPALLALDGPDPPAGFAVLFGGYYDLRDVLLFLTTGRHRDRGVEHDGETLPEGRWILLGANADRIADPAGREALREIALRRRGDPAAPIDDLVAGLDPGSRAALDLVANDDPARFDALYARLEPALREEIDALSPARALREPLHVDLLLLHGRGDAVVPWTQGDRIRRFVRTTGSTRLVLLGGFRHARPERAPEESGVAAALRHPGDSLGLLGVIGDLLARRVPDAPR
jgi:pimeloyl-ACP methyl ester carboxylesterase